MSYSERITDQKPFDHTDVLESAEARHTIMDAALAHAKELVPTVDWENDVLPKVFPHGGPLNSSGEVGRAAIYNHHAYRWGAVMHATGWNVNTPEAIYMEVSHLHYWVDRYAKGQQKRLEEIRSGVRKFADGPDGERQKANAESEAAANVQKYTPICDAIEVALAGYAAECFADKTPDVAAYTAALYQLNFMAKEPRFNRKGVKEYLRKGDIVAAVKEYNNPSRR